MYVWGANTGEVFIKLQGHESSIAYAAFSPDGKQIASASFDTTVRVWDMNTSAVLYTLEDHEDGVHSVVFSPDGRYISSGSYDKTMKFWDAKTGVARDVRQGYGGKVTLFYSLHAEGACKNRRATHHASRLRGSGVLCRVLSGRAVYRFVLGRQVCALVGREHGSSARETSGPMKTGCALLFSRRMGHALCRAQTT